MADTNKWLGLGNLTADPKVRTTPKGTTVCEIKIAVNRTYKTDSGEKREEVLYSPIITVWGKQGDAVAEYLSKGSPVFVEARLENNDYEKDGAKVYGFKLVAERVHFLGSKKGGSAAPRPTPVTARLAQETDDDSEVPF